MKRGIFLGRAAARSKKRRTGVSAYGRVGVSAYGRMGVWAYGRMGVWAYGRMGITRARTALLPDGTYETHETNVTDPLVP
jgi:hypothetical protein